MSGKLNFGQLVVGKTDARSEVILANPQSIETFQRVFFTPDGFNINEYISGDKFYVYGLKGTGKTAILKYIAIELQRYNIIDFVYFKTDLKQDDREKIESSACYDIGSGERLSEYDYEKMWRWFIIRRFVERGIEEGIFENDKNWERARKHILAVDLSKNSRGISYFFPKITNGKVTLNIKDIVSAELEFSFADREKKEVLFPELVDTCYSLFKKVVVKKKTYLFIDEIELSYLSEHDYSRDTKLIRDLIVCVKEINQEFRELNKDLFIIAAIRSEVINAVGAIGKEIQKYTEDNGFELNWHRYDRVALDHPLIHILINRIRNSEVNAFGQCFDSHKKLWSDYFTPEMFKISTQSFILNNTWFRPRDIIRWLILAQQIFPKNMYFDNSVIEGIRKQYSKKCWSEILEDLNTALSEEELVAVEKILTGFERQFDKGQFESRVEYQKKSSAEVRKLIDKYPVEKILDLLYSVGVIGNYYREFSEKMKDQMTYRFAFRGDKNLLQDKNMVIHQALYREFSIRDN